MADSRQEFAFSAIGEFGRFLCLSQRLLHTTPFRSFEREGSHGSKITGKLFLVRIPATTSSNVFGAQDTGDPTFLSDWNIEHGPDPEWAQIRVGKFPRPRIRMGIVGYDRALFGREREEIGRVVARSDDAIMGVAATAALKEVDQRDRGPILG